MKYVYPAILTPVEDGRYSVKVPDLPGCITCGNDLSDALYMCRDAIGMWVCDAEDNNEAVPAPSPALTSAHDRPDQITTLIDVDTAAYRRAKETRVIKKTLTLPSWLNELAESAGVNFSQTLQSALCEKLNVHPR